MNADHVSLFRSAGQYFQARAQTGVDCRRIFCRFFFREIVMRLSCMHSSISRAAIAAAVVVMEASWANAALASQGPGGGMGTASHLTQLAMAILVYGSSALVVGFGLIGAARRLALSESLTAPPVAVHARGDHRAARPQFLHVACGAISHRVGAGVIAGIDVRLPIGPIDRHAPQLPVLGGHLRDGHCRLPRA